MPPARRPALAALLCALAWGCSAPAPAPFSRCAVARPALTSGRLHTRGTALVDELGRQVFLRGFDAGSRSKWAPYAPFDFAPGSAADYRDKLGRYLDGAAGLGVDVLRVPFAWAAVEPTRGSDDADFLARHDQLLDAAWARGIRTVVDFHQDVYAENFCGDGFPAWTLPGTPPAPHHDCPRWFDAYGYPAVRAAFDAFWADGSTVQADYRALWTRMAARHKDRPGVIGFEPFNEPAAGTAAEATFEATTLTAFFDRMAALVNAAAPDALVFIDPPGVASSSHVSHLGALTGSGLVFAPHYYQPLTIFGGTGRGDLVESDLRSVIAPATAWGIPAFLGEWSAGHAAPDAADYVAAHHDAFDALGLSETQWEYSVSTEVWNAEPLDVAAADGSFLPLVEGMRRPHVAALAGTDLVVRRDGDAFDITFTPRPAADPAETITEVVVPDGVALDVTLTGACLDDTHPRRLLVAPTAGAAQVHLSLTRRR